MPSDVAPCKNWTLVTLPPGSDAVALTVKVAGALNTAPLAGLEIVTVGGVLAADWTVTEAVINA